MPAQPLEVLLEDGPLLAVNKPAGLATQAPAGFPSLEAAIKAWLKERHGKPGNVYLGIPHRLDRPVSGVVVFARNSKAAARLAEQFSERSVRKIYRAIVEGHVVESAGTLTDWLRKVPDEPRAVVSGPGDPDAREAVLSYRALDRFVLGEGSLPATLLEIELGTGRMHQIRVQFSSRGFPILGDARYGASSRWDPARQIWTPRLGPVPNTAAADASGEERHEERIALHAQSLALRHPIRYDELLLEAKPPEAWLRTIGSSR